ncbi:MAG: RecX family transcriptional regulator, partial [Chitinophagales bacterium]|nr:RecX family transcriptional regulator [Chitinophagales bacterium]
HAYARGKFNIKGRGRNKIQMELSQKGIDKEIIQDALREIDDAAYADKLKTMAIKKNKTILSENLFDRKTKLIRFLLSKGFEMDLIRKTVDEILPKK